MIALVEESVKVACASVTRDGTRLIALKDLVQEIALAMVHVTMAFVNAKINGLDHTVVYPLPLSAKRLAWLSAKRGLLKATRGPIVGNLACEIALKNNAINGLAFEDYPRWKHFTIGFMHSNK